MNTPSQTPSNGLTTFEFQSHPLRVIADEHGKPWFIAVDVCAILGYANSNKAIQEHCKTMTGGMYRYIPALSRRHKLIDEENLNLLVIDSDRPEAEAFKAWVCDEVLPLLAAMKNRLNLAENPINWSHRRKRVRATRTLCHG